MITNKLIITAICSCSALVQAQQKKPNILFILTDDQRWDAIGCAGNDIIHTPEMDKLAEKGTYFKNAFVSTPISAASRASIITGMYERSHGFTFQTPPLRKEVIENSYFSLLKNNGYFNGFIGKLGMWFEDKCDTALFDVYYPEKRDHYYRLTEGGTVHKHLTDRIGDKAVRFINTAPEDKPFCLSLSFHAPHAEDHSPRQYIWPATEDTLYSNVRIPGPVMSDSMYFTGLPEGVQEGFNRARWYWRFDTPEKYQEMVKGYYRMISGIDRVVGEIRQALDESGKADNTIIILMGDNGYFLGERQIAGKWLMYEQALRVPLIIYSPFDDTGRVIEDMALNIDIAPTILDIAGVPVPENYQGYSLAGYAGITDTETVPRKYFLCEHLFDFESIPSSEGIRSEKYKYRGK
jgi:arylsulfatase A-like enzyme